MEDIDESRYLDGKVCRTQFMSDIDGFQIFRSMNMGATTNCLVRDYTDFLPYTYFSWAYDYRLENGTSWAQVVGPSPRAIAEIANELYATNGTNILWYCTPMQSTDSCCSSIFSDFNTYLNTEIELWNEISNEVWNSGVVNRDGYYWVSRLEQTLREGTLVPATATVSDTSHGLSWGDAVRTYNHVDYAASWPWTFGGQLFAMVDDADTWRGASVAADIIDATQDNPCVITLDGNFVSASFNPYNIQNASEIEINSISGMTELNGNAYTVANIAYDSGSGETTLELSGVDSSAYTAYTSGGILLQSVIERGLLTPQSDQETIRYRPDVSGSHPSLNFAGRAVELWDLAEAEVSSHTFRRIGATQTGASGITSVLLGDSDYKAAIDYMALTTYFGPSGQDWTDEGYVASEANASTISDLSNVQSNLDEHIAYLGHCRVLSYEGGPSVPDDEGEEGDNQIDWQHNSGIGEVIKQYMHAIADAGFKTHIHYRSHGDKWGMMTVAGNTDDNSYQGYLPFLNDGGTITKS